MNYLSAVDSSFIDEPGGMARVAWDAAVAMRDRGHRVTVICRRQGDGEMTSEVDGMQIVRYQRPTLPSWHPGRAERRGSDVDVPIPLIQDVELAVGAFAQT